VERWAAGWATGALSNHSVHTMHDVNVAVETPHLLEVGLRYIRKTGFEYLVAVFEYFVATTKRR